MRLLLAVVLSLTLLIFIQAFSDDTASFAEQNTGTIELMIKNSNGDRVSTDAITVKVFKSYDKTALQEISLESNPINISSLPLGQRYRVEVYMNGMYAQTTFVNLEKELVHADSTIRNPGGMHLSIYYNDKTTPIPNAKIQIKSPDGKTWAYTETDQTGKTVRMWLSPTLKATEFYSAEITIGSSLRYVHSPIKLQPDISQEFKIVTKWPKIVNKLITVEVFKDTKTKVTREDGSFIAELYDSKKNKVAKSQVTRGVAHFANLNVGDYVLYVKSKSSTDSELKTIIGKKVTISGAEDAFKIYLNNPELNNDYLNCNCVAFRLDDIQDYFLASSQMEIMSTFQKKNTPITIGVIGGLIGDDQKLISFIKNNVNSDNPTFEIASRSWNNQVLSTLPKQEQESLIKITNEKIFSVFGIRPTIFIPPENLFNVDTVSSLKENNFTHISYAITSSEPPSFKKSSFYHFPAASYTARLNPATTYLEHTTNQQILEQIQDSLLNYGYAVVMMKPYEFSVYENGLYKNQVNATKIKELESLIDKIKAANYTIMPIGQIDKFDQPKLAKSKQPKEQTIQNCNCVAFRLDNVQDFYLNDVQNSIINEFVDRNLDLTITMIGKFTGSDPKTIDFIKQKLDSTSKLEIGNRGWEFVDHNLYDENRQYSSIKQTNDKIMALFNQKPSIFSPPQDMFNKDTINAMKQNGMTFISAGIDKDVPPFDNSIVLHVPSTGLFSNFIYDDSFLTGTIEEKAIQKIQSNLQQYGFSMISIQVQDFAVKQEDGTYKNEVDENKIKLLRSILNDIKSENINIVSIKKIPSLFDSQILVPEWVRNNAKWWSAGQIEDNDFTSGIEYMIKEGIILVSESSGQKLEKGVIPDWVKNNAGWWAQGLITEGDFLNGVKYLVEKGIIGV